jgi:hypothetical protein
MKRTLAIATAVIGLTGVLRGQIVIKNQGFLPFSGAPINYRSEQLSDPIAVLQKQLDRGEAKLEYEPGHGYLKSVLRVLGIAVNSQTLVFSKTSFQYPKITPERPRALYFNDDVYVGQVHEGMALEFVSFDPMQGAIFYILDEHRVERPRFERAELDCVQCHVAASTTRGVPGVMVRSVATRPTGFPAGGAPTYLTGHESPMKDRWGGWYVTGDCGKQTHMGNTTVSAAGQPERLDHQLDTTPYLTGTSDIVAHLVLAHQTQMHNLITQTNYQTRQALFADEARNKAANLPGGTISETARLQFQKPAEQLVRYLLFANEAPLEDRVEGGSGYAQEFAAKGPRDARGRSLRDFDLRTRIFKYPCSYLIYSEAFDAIPGPAKEYIYRRLFEVLSGRDQSSEFASLTGEDRRAILEILVATKPGVPEEWKQFSKQ